MPGKKTAICGREGLADPTQFVMVDGTLLHKVGKDYHRVSDGISVNAFKEGTQIVLKHQPWRPIDPGANLRF